jgi:hypothetical protein
MDITAYVLGSATVGGSLPFPVETTADRPINIQGGETIYEQGQATTTIYLQGTPD